MKILVIDDKMEVVELLNTHLSREGHDVNYALDGEEGFFMTQSTNYDLIFVDQDMPKMTGLEFIRKLKGSKNSSSRIIMLTGDYMMQDFLVEFLGADGFIRKPFSFKDIDKVLN